MTEILFKIQGKNMTLAQIQELKMNLRKAGVEFIAQIKKSE